MQVSGRHKRRSGRVWGLLEVRGLLMTDEHTGMVNQTQQREEGVFLFHIVSRQEGAGLCTPLHNSHVIYLIVFFPLARNPAGAATTQKSRRSVKVKSLAFRHGACYINS